MSFDFSTLIIDRTQADVTKKAAKGFYNASDLNRVTACMEYLDEELRKLGYESGYKKVVIERPSTSRLPSGYTELEYIEGTGTQYIDTGVPPGPYILTFDFSFSQNGKRNLMGHTANGGWYFGCYENGDYDGGIAGARINLSAYSRRTIKIESSSGSSDSIQTLTVDGQTVTAQRSTSVSQNLSVFKITGSNYWVSGRLYNGPFTVELNGELFRDFVPCKNQLGKSGVYDLVSKSFIGSSGANDFISGPEVPPTPSPLDPYTWYESDVPTVTQMAQYLENVSAIRSVFTLPEDAPQTPQSMALLTFAKANDIEKILEAVDSMLAKSISFLCYSGDIYSGEV